jgi:hypothetical protein
MGRQETAVSIRALNWAWATPTKGSTKLVLLALADHSDNDGICWPGIKGIAQKCGLMDRTVQLCLSQLIQAGLISKTERQRRSNLYQLHLDVKSTPNEISTPGGEKITPSRVQTFHHEGENSSPGGEKFVVRTPIEPLIEPDISKSEDINRTPIKRTAPPWDCEVCNLRFRIGMLWERHYLHFHTNTLEQPSPPPLELMVF